MIPFHTKAFVKLILHQVFFEPIFCFSLRTPNLLGPGLGTLPQGCGSCAKKADDWAYGSTGEIDVSKCI